MKVVFLEEVEGTAMAGDVKNVADGFARNFLLPRKLAAPATEHYINIATQKATKYARRQDRLDEEARDKVLPMVDGKSITIEVRVGEQEKLFGSVTSRDIAEALQAETKVELEHKQVELRQPIREVGAHQVPVKITRNVVATVTVNVVRLGGEEEADAAAQAAEVATEPEASAESEEAEVSATEAAAPVDEEPSPAELADAEVEAPADEDAAETAIEDTAAEAEASEEEDLAIETEEDENVSQEG
ncbi:MAG TPA: 50S ribosomal protein L9 [Dehalococcoidia bacterium]|nr:50S ribosomal protein L9 [Dehalococcoidia bacterium]